MIWKLAVVRRDANATEERVEGIVRDLALHVRLQRIWADRQNRRIAKRIRGAPSTVFAELARDAFVVIRILALACIGDVVGECVGCCFTGSRSSTTVEGAFSSEASWALPLRKRAGAGCG